MKKFIFKSSCFILPIILFALLLFAFVKNNIRREISNSDIIVVGDSHIKFIDLPNTYNYSIDGAAYFAYFSFFKEFKNSLKNKKILLAFNYHNLSNLYQNRLSNDDLWPGWKEYNTKKINKFNLYNKYIYDDINKNYSLLKSFDFEEYFEDLKRYYSTEEENSAEIITDTTIIFKSVYNHWLNPKNSESDIIQRKYLEKIILFLKENENEIILLKMPVTKDYYNQVPLEIKNELESYSKKYDLKILDMHEELKIGDNYNLFKDYAHLNINGDSIVNKFLTNKLMLSE